MFIEGKKFKELREAAHNGDERARKILRGYGNDEDVTMLIEEYFKPVKEEPEVEEIGIDEADMTPLEKFLRDNGVEEGDEDYDEYVKEFHETMGEEEPEEVEEIEEVEEENPIQDLIDDELEAIRGYGKYLDENVYNNVEMCDGKRAIIISTIKNIMSDEERHINELRDLMCHKED